MYFCFGIFLVFCIIFFVLCHWRKKHIIQKICCMDICEKVHILDDVLRPFGFSYCMGPDIITSRTDAWQREFGYCAAFDKSAPYFGMVFDCEPVYFDYQGQTWLIEFWKGQYGINTGSEIGIYHADHIVNPQQYDRTLFHSISDSQMMNLSMELFYKGKALFCIRKTHWWLTGFCVGHFCEPGNLTMKVSVTFPNAYMMQAFVDSLVHTGYGDCAIFICGLTVSFTFAVPCTRQCHCRLLCRLTQWRNRFFCWLYRLITRPFVCTLDRLLYLYFFLPACFRRIIRCRRHRKQKCPHCCKKKQIEVSHTRRTPS